MVESSEMGPGFSLEAPFYLSDPRWCAAEHNQLYRYYIKRGTLVACDAAGNETDPILRWYSRRYLAETIRCWHRVVRAEVVDDEDARLVDGRQSPMQTRESSVANSAAGGPAGLVVDVTWTTSASTGIGLVSNAAVDGNGATTTGNQNLSVHGATTPQRRLSVDGNSNLKEMARLRRPSAAPSILEHTHFAVSSTATGEYSRLQQDGKESGDMEGVDDQNDAAPASKRSRTSDSSSRRLSDSEFLLGMKEVIQSVSTADSKPVLTAALEWVQDAYNNDNEEDQIDVATRLAEDQALRVMAVSGPKRKRVLEFFIQ
ncbi:hypothetical protein H9P43_005156 [Blastocladiella emersonii ATCC 22665]|nr:hypothetical protein H9P43_005156 [Blastocladiella emersonii ATCC 22665]